MLTVKCLITVFEWHYDVALLLYHVYIVLCGSMVLYCHLTLYEIMISKLQLHDITFYYKDCIWIVCDIALSWHNI